MANGFWATSLKFVSSRMGMKVINAILEVFAWDSTCMHNDLP